MFPMHHNALWCAGIYAMVWVSFAHLKISGFLLKIMIIRTICI